MSRRRPTAEAISHSARPRRADVHTYRTGDAWDPVVLRRLSPLTAIPFSELGLQMRRIQVHAAVLLVYMVSIVPGSFCDRRCSRLYSQFISSHIHLHG